MVDYYGTPKLAYHALTRSQEAVCLLFREPKDGTLELVCANDTLKGADFVYRITDVTNDKTVSKGQGFAAANATSPVCRVPYTGDETVVYLIEWTVDGKTCRNHYVSGKIPHDPQKILDGYRKVGLLELYVK